MADIKQIDIGGTKYNIEPYTSYLPLSGGTVTGRIYSNEWIQFSTGGLFWPTNEGHIKANEYTSYAPIAVLGNRGGYNGMHFGQDSSGMTIMSIPGSYQGLYCEGLGRWIIINVYGGGTSVGGYEEYAGYNVVNCGHTYVSGIINTAGAIHEGGVSLTDKYIEKSDITFSSGVLTMNI